MKAHKVILIIGLAMLLVAMYPMDDPHDGASARPTHTARSGVSRLATAPLVDLTSTPTREDIVATFGAPPTLIRQVYDPCPGNRADPHCPVTSPPEPSPFPATATPIAGYPSP